MRINVHVTLIIAIMIPVLFAVPPAVTWDFNDGPGAGVTGSVESVAGKTGKGLRFDGATGSLTVPVPEFNAGFTFEAWAKPAAVPALRATIFGRRGFHNDLGYDSDQHFYFGIYNTEKAGFTAVSKKTYAPGEWHRITGVFDAAAGKVRLYVDGELAGETKFTGTVFAYNKEAAIGAANPNSPKYAFWFNGDIDDIRVWNSVLSESEIGGAEAKPETDNANTTGQPVSAPPVAAWDFNDGPGAEAIGNVAGVAGKTGKGLRFDGATGYRIVPLPKLESSVTFEAWAKPAAVPVIRATIFGRKGFHNDLGYDSDRHFYFGIYNTDKTGFTAVSKKTYDPGAWHRITGVFDAAAGKVSLYVDGEAAGETKFTGTVFQYPYEAAVGVANPASPKYAFWFNGDIDDIRVWPRALAASEIIAGVPWSSAVAAATTAGTNVAGKIARVPEAVAPVSDELISAIKTRGPQTARVTQRAGEAPVLEINGKPSIMYGGDVWMLGPYKQINIQPYFKAGMDIINVQLNLGFASEKSGHGWHANVYMKPYWTGKDRYDAADLEKMLWRPLQGNSNAKIILWLWIDPYAEWPSEHPGECLQNERGEYAYGESHTMGFTNGITVPGPGQMHRTFWSFHSEVFRDEIAAMLTNLIADIEKLVPGNAVVGYLIGGGQDAQLYHWNMPNGFLASKTELWGDYSPAGRKAWKKYIAAKYGTPAAVSGAWGKSIRSFDDVEPPPPSDLVGGATFHDPVKERQAMDWKRFQTDARQSLIDYWAKTIKSGATRPVIVGACVGESQARRDSSHVEEANHSANLDFFLHQASYNQRIPPNLGGINAYLASMAANGKIFCVDLDHPTYLQPPPKTGAVATGISAGALSMGHAENIGMLTAMWRREISHMWATGAGVLWNHVFGPAYSFDAPEIIDEMKFLVDTARWVKPSTVSQPMQDVALIYDEKSIDFARSGLATLPWIWIQLQQNEFLASGTPYGQWHMADLRDGKIPPAKLYIFQNALDLNPRNIEAIEKIKKDGAVIVFLHDTGYAQSRMSSAATEKAAGMKLVPAETVPVFTGVYDTSHPLVEWKASKKTTDAVAWPRTWRVYGPIAKTDADPVSELRSIPAAMSIAGRRIDANVITVNGIIDLAKTLGVSAREGVGAWVMTEMMSDSDCDIEMGSGADWWMSWYVNGVPVYNTMEKGNGKGEYSVNDHRFTLRLKKGVNVLAVKVLSGSAGFQLISGGPGEIGQAKEFNAKREGIKTEQQYTIVPADPAATMLAAYADAEKPGMAVKDNGTWKSVFIGTRLLSREMIAVLARYAGAWRVTKPGTVVEVGQNFLMLHPLESGVRPVRWKHDAVFTPIGRPGTPVRGTAVEFDLKAGETYLYKIDKK
ncbi:MAG: beta-galactosidase [Spirochaetes bacterium]|nr:beta-galactosidase [Spirochaetota bacterium]